MKLASEVRDLIIANFPEYAYLPVKEIFSSGRDNDTYRLGSEYIVRLPKVGHELQIRTECHLLPKLPVFAVKIPVLVELCSEPLCGIYKWLDGESIDLLHIDVQVKLAADSQFALILARFLNELWSCRLNCDGLLPGKHNWWCGAHISVYDKAFREQIIPLGDRIDFCAVIKIKALSCKRKLGFCGKPLLSYVRDMM